MAVTMQTASSETDSEDKRYSVRRLLPKLALGSALSVGVIYFLSQRIDMQQLLGLAGNIQVSVIVLAVAVYWSSLFLRACRWKVLIGKAPEVRVLPLFSAFVIGAGFNTLIPAKIGELFRIQVSSRWLTISRLRLAGGIFIEKCQDMLVLLGFFASGIYVVANKTTDPALLTKVLVIASALLSAAALGLFVVFFFYPRLLRRAKSSGIVKLIDSFVAGISGAVTTGISRNLILTLGIWVADLATLWLILYSIQIDLKVLELMLLTGAYSFISLVPSAPVHLGTYQAAFVFVFAILGHSAESAFLGALLVQACLLAPVALLAVVVSFWFWRDFLKFRRQ